MTLYRNALRVLNVSHVYGPRLAGRRLYASLGDDGDVTKPTGVIENGEAKEAQKQKQKPLNQDPRVERVRSLMRQQPHGLAAVVAPSVFPPEGEKIRGAWEKFQPPGPLSQTKAALLVSSFNTVTISPIPYISFNIKTPSSTYKRICDYGEFMVTGLDDAGTAKAFADRDEVAEAKGRPWWSRFVDERGRVESDCGGTWWMRCKVQTKSCSRVGDHRILVAEVLEAGSEREDQPDGKLAQGLVYLDGSYRYVGHRMPGVSKRFSKTFRVKGFSINTRYRKPKEAQETEVEQPGPTTPGKLTIRRLRLGPEFPAIKGEWIFKGDEDTNRESTNENTKKESTDENTNRESTETAVYRPLVGSSPLSKIK